MVLEIKVALQRITKLMNEHEIKFDRSDNLRCYAMDTEHRELNGKSASLEIDENLEVKSSTHL